MPMNAGTPCTNKIDRLAVSAPPMPAIATQTRKNSLTEGPCGVSRTTKAHTSPAAKNPL